MDTITYSWSITLPPDFDAITGVYHYVMEQALLPLFPKDGLNLSEEGRQTIT